MGAHVGVGCDVSVVAVVVNAGWQAPNPESSAKMTRKLNTERLVHMALSLPNKKTAVITQQS